MKSGMKFGLFGMNMRPCVTPEAIATIACAAEDAGFESFWGGEHLALADPQTPTSPMPPRIDFVDLNVTMAFVAAHTRTLRFGTGIMILPLRNPVVLAKQLASVDVMSGGRLIFGIGIGNLEFEFNAVGMPFNHKGQRAEEMLAAMKALWMMERAEFHGRYFSFAGVRAEPRPIQRPHPEIVFGGKTSYAFSRTARLGNGWYGYALDLDAARDCIEGIRIACTNAGRRFEEIEVSITPKGNLDPDMARRYAALGVRRLILPPRGRDVGEVLQAITVAERDLIGKV
ncbi:MAG: TIGR03619 family F420-dependent LLM class oxidoreductase [Deltaproteobacteria bacterium]|nr:TIGR03619 family F420-dependent LLM class oxidoreductase [Deltaproteobacteria bacterium]